MGYQWIPLFGEFVVSDDLITYKGKRYIPPPNAQSPPITESGAAASETPQPQLGHIICNQRLIEGTVSAEFEFDEISAATSCQLVLFYDVDTKEMITVGVPGSICMFCILAWVPTQPGRPESGKWETLSIGGDRTALRPNVQYKIEVNVKGSRITLSMNGVHVATTNMSKPISQPKQIGLWCASFKDIKIRNFKADIQKPKAFIVTQYSQPFDDLYSEVIKDACVLFGYDPVRADEIHGPGLIIRDIVEQIVTSQVVVADITPNNPNVYFEIGYALALNKPVILMAQKDTPLPFDISGLRVLFYENSIGGKTRVQEGIKNHLKAIVGRS